MKKSLAVLILVTGMTGSIFAQQAATIPEPRRVTETTAGAYDASMTGEFDSNLKKFGWGLLMYVPNRLCDVLDLFTIRLGAGGTVGAGFQITEYCQLQGQYGEFGFLSTGHKRQWGGGVFNGFTYGLGCFKRDFYGIGEPLGWQKGFELADSAMNVVSLSDDRYKSGTLDPWAIGANFALLFDVAVYVHPVAIVDLVAGVLMIDLDNDDF